MADSSLSMVAAWRAAFAAPDRRSIQDWAASNVNLPATLSRSGKYDPKVSPHFNGILKAIQSDGVREVSILKPVRGGGTLIADLAVPWAIACENAGILWAFHDEQLAKEHAELRQLPIIKRCKPLREMLPADKHKQRTQEIIFNNGLPLIFCGPAISNFQSRGFKWVILDEPWLYKAGIMGQAISRLGDFVRMGNSKLICISQGGEIEGDWDLHLKEQVMHEYAVPCLAVGCGRFFFLEWSAHRADRSRWGIRFEAKAENGGGYDVAAAIKSLRFECPHCSHAHPDGEGTRQAWRTRGRWVCKKEGAESPEVSDFPIRSAFHWTAILDYPWHDLLRQFLAAQRAKKLGNYEPLTTFMQKRLAEFASEDSVHDRENLFVTYEADEAHTADPLKKAWEGEAIRFMSIDRQGEQTYWVMVRAWARGTGESRGLYFGKAHGEAELEALRVKFGVHPKCVVIDSGFEARGDGGVYAACIRYGWIATRGDDKRAFVHATKLQNGTTQRVFRPWAPTAYGDPGMGTADQGRRRCALVVFSAPTTASRVQGLIDSGLWLEPKNQDGVSEEMVKEYTAQMTAEFLRPKVNAFTKRKEMVWVCPSGNNHAFDCAKMQVLAAMQSRLLPMGDDVVEEAKE